MIKMTRNGVNIQIHDNDVQRYLRMGWTLVKDVKAEAPEEKPAAEAKPKTAAKTAAKKK